MCGIVGYAGSRRAAPIIYEALLRLEYRGYDSAGLATLSEGSIAVAKRQGRVEKLAPLAKDMRGTVGIGHTRWATHGVPSDKNAHPHSAGAFTIVHNGIIENYSELKAELIREGAAFFSETDSEVIAHLLDRNYSGDALSALIKTLGMLKGSYALMAICKDFDGFIVAKRKSPVILGYGEGENFCASDEPALAGLCDTICVLEDGDIAFVTAKNVDIYDKNGNLCRRKRLKNQAVPAAIGLGGCAHFMQKEIREVPASIKNTLSAYLDAESAVKKAVDGADRIILVGCGTAYHAALLGKRYIEAFARMTAEAETSGEFRYKDPVLSLRTVVVAVTQSGETADTVEAARLAATVGAKVLAVTNCPRSAIARIADVVVPVAAGPEICVAATKSYTGQVAALYLLAHTLAGTDGTGKLSRAAQLAAETVEHIDMREIAHMCASSSGVYFLGRDIDYAVALEGSLKLKEVSYVPGEGYPAGEIKHGALALIDGGTTTIVIISDCRLEAKSRNAVHEVLSRGGKVAVVTTLKGVKEKLAGRAEVITLPECDGFLSPFVTAVAVQELAYRTALLLGRDPDKPRNLAKSVTVE